MEEVAAFLALWFAHPMISSIMWARARTARDANSPKASLAELHVRTRFYARWTLASIGLGFFTIPVYVIVCAAKMLTLMVDDAELYKKELPPPALPLYDPDRALATEIDEAVNAVHCKICGAGVGEDCDAGLHG